MSATGDHLETESVRHRRKWAAPLSAWVLATIFLIIIDASITRTEILWGEAAFENTQDPRRFVFAQTYRAVRKIYHPSRAAEHRVVLLGNSRILFGAWNEADLEEEIVEFVPDLDVRVDNLGVYGAVVGELEVLSRHLSRAEPTLVVLAISPADLLSPASGSTGSIRLLDIGWRDGPLPVGGVAERVQRWGRTVWPLFRFREFAQAAIEDRVLSRPNPGRPERFSTPREVFDFIRGERAAEMEAAYGVWQQDRSLDNFVRFIDAGRPTYLPSFRGTVRRLSLPPGDGPLMKALNVLLERISRTPGEARILLMPQNPLIRFDRDHEYQRPALELRVVESLQRLARRWEIPVIDARHWIPAEGFLDFDHMLPSLSGFRRPLAREIALAIEN